MDRVHLLSALRAQQQRWLGIALIAALAAAFAPAQEASNQVSYQGTLGPARIGLTIIVTPGNTIAGGHYFYAKYLEDIPLNGSFQDGSVILKGQDGGIFTLKLTGNTEKNPPNVNNTTGLAGDWSKDSKSLPVALMLNGQSAVPQSGRWYEMVTDKSDAVFEAKARGFYNAVLAGDKSAAAKYVSFPLRVNQNGKNQMIHSAAELSAQWEKLFTAGYLNTLKKDMPHDMNISNGQAMLGAGDVWFGSKGATALNLP
ncbi:hypothetical protein ACPOL_5190 [Acidisarcina polymorpha]|uniref:Uncharacterized protein n=1 Tax=Acidisarcina polymorpha TaxID=2211140 RepID=A0A2Z5G6X8_9BACT|nr:hypothetical protein [Acidisarcina polymorpha]AXC14444.1 hypothetical protein ACPOL_5190 [Acidisarcina polymorpha]